MLHNTKNERRIKKMLRGRLLYIVGGGLLGGAITGTITACAVGSLDIYTGVFLVMTALGSLLMAWGWATLMRGL
jgi:hypothetical protein